MILRAQPYARKPVSISLSPDQMRQMYLSILEKVPLVNVYNNTEEDIELLKVELIKKEK